MGRDRDQLLALAARLYYLDQLSQSAIAEMVGVSPSQVSRILTQARERGIVRISVAPYEPRDVGLEEALARRFGLHRAIVVRAVEGASPAQVRRTIGYFAGPAVSEWIRADTVVGLAGGRTLRELVAYLHPCLETPLGVKAVQLMGNVGASVSPVDAAALNHEMAERLGGTFYALSAPAVAPDAHTRDAFTSHAYMQSIQQLFAVMELAFVGIGSLDDSVFIERGVLQSTDLDELRSQGAAGEICGRFYDERGEDCHAAYHDRVISITLEQLRHVPEIVGVTNGSGRASPVRAALRGGLLTSLVTDDQCAAALLQIA